jgi:hypothetical protein
VRTVRYVGWRDDLKGRTALARPDSKPGRVLVQFDAPQSGEVEDANPYDSKLCFGWHDFSANDFEDISKASG